VKVETKTIKLDSLEEDLVIKSLNKIRTERLSDNKCDRDVSEVMLKILQAPVRKARKRNEAR